MQGSAPPPEHDPQIVSHIENMTIEGDIVLPPGSVRDIELENTISQKYKSALLDERGALATEYRGVFSRRSRQFGKWLAAPFSIYVPRLDDEDVFHTDAAALSFDLRSIAGDLASAKPRQITQQGEAAIRPTVDSLSWIATYITFMLVGTGLASIALLISLRGSALYDPIMYLAVVPALLSAHLAYQWYRARFERMRSENARFEHDIWLRELRAIEHSVIRRDVASDELIAELLAQLKRLQKKETELISNEEQIALLRKVLIKLQARQTNEEFAANEAERRD